MKMYGFFASDLKNKAELYSRQYGKNTLKPEYLIPTLLVSEPE